MRFSALLFSLLALVAQPAAAASSPNLLSLEQQLSSMAAGKSADDNIKIVAPRSSGVRLMRSTRAKPSAACGSGSSSAHGTSAAGATVVSQPDTGLIPVAVLWRMRTVTPRAVCARSRLRLMA